LLVYNTVLAIVFMVPLIILTGEVGQIMKMTFLTNGKFWFTMIISALCGYLINIAFFLQIQYTSPLSNTISGTAKACVQTILGVIFFNESLSLLVRYIVAQCVSDGIVNNKL